ncbi:OmpA family protein [Primorskyibacter sp. S87]|uniref:OmpA family protein n=1 Tax=Primorskyibacter sp. S87 TaxID=3415126 RepID=UPI003C7D5A21
MAISKTIIAASSAVFLLGACTNPASLTATSVGEDPYKKTKEGALVGGVLGAGIGALTGTNTATAALAGAAVGAIAGGAIGAQLDKQAAELRQELSNDGISITNAGDRMIVSVPNDITFATDSAEVNPALRSDLDRVAANLLKYPDNTVQVIGHTDSDGEAGYNQSLSERRANSVADILQTGGVPYTRLTTAGRGEDAPIASNLTDDGKAQNRRVEIVVFPNEA